MKDIKEESAGESDVKREIEIERKYMRGRDAQGDKDMKRAR